MKNLIVPLLFLLLLPGCNKQPKDDPCNTPVLAIPCLFSISNDNNDDLFSQKYLGNFPIDSVKIYHKDGNGYHDDSITLEKRPDVPQGQNAYMIGVTNALNLSFSGIKTFFFKRNFNLIDTLYFDETNNKINNCNNYVLHSFTYNRMPLQDSHEGYFIIQLKHK